MWGKRWCTVLVLLLGSACYANNAQIVAPTLEEDWKVLAATEWVNTKPIKAWEGLDGKWQDLMKAQGVAAWSKVVVSFADPPKKDRRLAWKFYAIKMGKESVEKNASVVLKLDEKDGQRYLVIGNPGTKVKFTLKKDILTLEGTFGSKEDAIMPAILTGDYKVGGGKGVPEKGAP